MSKTNAYWRMLLWYDMSNNPAEPEAVKCWTTAPNMVLILYITNYYSCIRSIKFSQLYLGFLVDLLLFLD